MNRILFSLNMGVHMALLVDEWWYSSLFLLLVLLRSSLPLSFSLCVYVCVETCRASDQPVSNSSDCDLFLHSKVKETLCPQPWWIIEHSRTFHDCLRPRLSFWWRRAEYVISAVAHSKNPLTRVYLYSFSAKLTLQLYVNCELFWLLHCTVKLYS